MKNNKKKKGYIIAFLLILIYIIIQVTYIVAKENDKMRISVYSWHIDKVDCQEFKSISKDLDINSFYQYMPALEINTSETFNNLVNDLKKFGVKTYLLTGTPNQVYDEEIIELKKLIDEVEKYNINNDVKLEGIVLDAEFYLDEKYNKENKEGCFLDYYNNVKKAYEYAKKKNIKFILVIPYWLDTTFGVDKLEILIKDSCDSIEVMNYYKQKTKEHIKSEIELAKKYNKSIVTISELQKANEEEAVTTQITFYTDGLQACTEDMKLILKEYNYNKLGYAYHYYDYLIELYNN